MKFFAASLMMLSVICGMSLFAADTGTVQDESTGITFPSEVSFQAGGKDYRLKATGVATREKFFVKVYSVAHYMQNPAEIAGNDKFQAIVNSDQAKQLTMKWNRAVPADKIQEGFHDSFAKELSDADQAKLKPQIDAFVAFFSSEAKKGEEYNIRSLPGGTIEVLIGGKSVGKITNADFAKAVWGIWFGENKVVKRDRLVSLMQ